MTRKEKFVFFACILIIRIYSPGSGGLNPRPINKGLIFASQVVNDISMNLSNVIPLCIK
jgi:hypothetical protein